MQAALTHPSENSTFALPQAWFTPSDAPTRTAQPVPGRGSAATAGRKQPPASRANRQASTPKAGSESARTECRQTGYRDVLSAEQEQSLARRMAHPRNRSDYEAARQTLISANLRLVVFVARRYQREAFPLEDLVQEGTVGLIQAVDRFDYRQGVRLSTYALWWIRQAILSALAEHGALIRLPGHIQTSLRHLQKTEQSLSASLGRPPSQEEWAKAAGMTEERMSKLLTGAMPTVSLEALASPTQETPLADLIPADEECDPARQVALRDSGQMLRQAIGTLNQKEQDILMMHYGLEDDEPKSLEQISRAWRVSHERVRQIEVRALQKLRRCLHSTAL